MKVFALILIPIGLMLSAMLLSSSTKARKWAADFATRNIADMNCYVFTISLTYGWLIALMTFLLWMHQNQRLSKVLNGTLYGDPGAPFSETSFILLKRIKVQRDFWILFFNWVIWLFVARFSQLLCKHWMKVEAIKRNLTQVASTSVVNRGDTKEPLHGREGLMKKAVMSPVDSATAADTEAVATPTKGETAASNVNKEGGRLVKGNASSSEGNSTLLGSSTDTNETLRKRR